MGLWQSGERRREEEEEEEGDDGEEENHEEEEVKQEPECVPFGSSASPLSPQMLSSTVRIWDPGNVLSPLPSSTLHANSPKTRRLSSHRLQPKSFADNFSVEIYLIDHGECNISSQSDLITGRWPSAVLTAEGKRQARALGVFLLSQGVHFDAAISSPLERCKQTAISVCEEVNFPPEKIEFSDALAEMSQGHWEGLRCSDVYTTELLSIMANSLLDFHAPGGESLRQVEFRMIEFFNNSILPRAAEKARKLKDASGSSKNIAKEKSHSSMQVHPLNEDDERSMGSMKVPLSKHRYTVVREGRKSRLQMVSTAETRDAVPSDENTKSSASLLATKCMLPTRIHEEKALSKSDPFCFGRKSRLHMVSTAETTDTVLSDENAKLSVSQFISNGIPPTRMLEEKANSNLDPFYVSLFSHGMAIKCLMRGILGSDPHITHRLCIDNTSVTVVRYSYQNGWQIQRVNDTAHLRLL